MVRRHGHGTGASARASAAASNERRHGISAGVGAGVGTGEVGSGAGPRASARAGVMHEHGQQQRSNGTPPAAGAPRRRGASGSSRSPGRRAGPLASAPLGRLTVDDRTINSDQDKCAFIRILATPISIFHTPFLFPNLLLDGFGASLGRWHLHLSWLSRRRTRCMRVCLGWKKGRITAPSTALPMTSRSRRSS